MTCIVGIERDGVVIIGGDSAGTAGHIQRERADEKVFVLEDFAFGFCGSYRTGQLLRHALTVPAYDPRTDPERYLCGPFIDAVRQTLTDHGAMRTNHGVQELDGPFLVGWRGRLYAVDGDFQVARMADPYAVTGSGWQLALGALAAMNDVLVTRTPDDEAHRDTVARVLEDQVRQALAAAARFDAYVAPPFLTVRTPEP